MHDTQYVDGNNRTQDPLWDEEMEKKRRARMWMEQRMMEEQMRRRRQRMEFGPGFREAHRNNPEREEAMKLFFRNLILRMLGAFIVIQLFFSSMIPSGCPQYAQGCSCNKCMSQENYMKRLAGAQYNRLGHPRGCSCQLCVAVYRNLQHSSSCQCSLCRTPQ